MIDVLNYLSEREEEFMRHLAIARMLEARLDQAPTPESVKVEVRHVNTIKSGLLIHLYNIVEAVCTRTLKAVGDEVVSDLPRKWSEDVRKEWIRAEVWSGEDTIGDGVVKRLSEISKTLAEGGSPPPFVVKGESGSWTDGAIKKVAERLGCNLEIPEDIRRAAYEPSYRNNKTAMGYLADRRNAIAHGATTFEEGASELTLGEIEILSDKVIPYLKAVSESYQSFLNNRHYLVAEEV